MEGRDSEENIVAIRVQRVKTARGNKRLRKGRKAEGEKIRKREETDKGQRAEIEA